MLNPLSFLSKIIKPKNQKELDKIGKIVDKINNLEPQISKYSEEEFKVKTNEFKKKLENGDEIKSILPEAFALVREASKRINN